MPVQNPDQKYVGTLLPNPKDPSWYREDGTLKGPGYLGMMQRGDNPRWSSGEISTGVDRAELGPQGKNVPLSKEGYVDIPQMVPGLTQNEIDFLLNVPVDQQYKSNPELADRIHQKSVEFAKSRLDANKPIFAGPEESPFALPRMKYQPKLSY